MLGLLLRPSAGLTSRKACNSSRACSGMGGPAGVMRWQEQGHATEYPEVSSRTVRSRYHRSRAHCHRRSSTFAEAQNATHTKHQRNPENPEPQHGHSPVSRGASSSLSSSSSSSVPSKNSCHHHHRHTTLTI